MSGGFFSYDQFKINEIAKSIQLEIDRSGKEIPEKERWYDEDWYIKYPEDKYYPTHSPKVLDRFKKAVTILKEASVYAHRIDWYLSGDDGEETFLKRLEQDLNDLQKPNKRQ